MKKILTFFFLISSFHLFSQVFSELPSMPEPVANNAVTGATVNGISYVFSFSGIDQTKLYTGIHKKAFRYNTQTQVWDEIAELPSGNGRIAAGASTVKNKIYIIGGYEVFSTGSEISVDKVHIYDPETNSYEADGTPIPVAIDDHVQAVWRDSLIYVVTGWSNNMNVPNVQIYNPSNDEWLVGTSTPNSNNYKVFGGSGEIIGDTIFYLGGARFASNFPASSIFRKGVINPDNPTEIFWTFMGGLNATGYRSAAFLKNDQEIFWVGGSDVTYNFDGIAYNGSGGVSPREDWRFYSNELDAGTPDMQGNAMPEVMDLRGIAHLNSDEGIIAGGMVENQEVTDKVFLINFNSLVSNQNIQFPPIKIFPNPISDFFIIEKVGNFELEIYDGNGRFIFSKNKSGGDQVDISNLNSGNYFLKIFENGKWIGLEKIVISR